MTDWAELNAVDIGNQLMFCDVYENIKKCIKRLYWCINVEILDKCRDPPFALSGSPPY